MALTPPLHADTDGRGPRLVLVHGFTQTGRCWGPVGVQLATDHEVVRVDAPGHGRSAHDDADLWRAGDLVAERGERGTYVGYSMGGRIALHVAIAHPELVERLVLIGATPGIRDAAQRAERVRADEALADRLVAIGTAAFVDEWLALPMFEGLSAEADCRTARLENRASGLAASLRSCGTGTQAPLWDRLGDLAMPVHWFAGARDEAFLTVAQEAAERCPRGSWRALPDAGHTAHLEAPEAFLDELRQAER